MQFLEKLVQQRELKVTKSTYKQKRKHEKSDAILEDLEEDSTRKDTTKKDTK
jgi:hypothetical protein